jgi:hypothetical protein
MIDEIRYLGTALLFATVSVMPLPATAAPSKVESPRDPFDQLCPEQDWHDSDAKDGVLSTGGIR